MKQFFCDKCNNQVYEHEDLISVKINDYDVDLCRRCNNVLVDQLSIAKRQAGIDFMKTMVRQPLGFRYKGE